VGDTVDSWKVIIVEPEKQLALLFGMKAPGLGRLCFTLKDKAITGTGRARLVASARMPGLFYWLLMIPAHLFIFRGMAKRIAQQNKKRKELNKTLFLSPFPLHSAVIHERMRTKFFFNTVD
jgi:hypothetical protein